MQDIVERADKLSRKRARIFMVIPPIFLMQQVVFFAEPMGERMVDHARLAAWLLLAGVMLAALLTGGFWTRPRDVRALMNDEVTLANRASAIALGFAASIITGMAIMLALAIQPGSVQPMVAVHLIVSAGLVCALIRFGVLERRSLG